MESINKKGTVSIAAAAKAIESGDSIWVSGHSESIAQFLEELQKRESELKNVTLVMDHIEMGQEIGSIKNQNSFKVISGLSAAIVQTYMNSNKQDFLNATGKRVVEMLCRNFGINTIVAEMLPPDKAGMCNLGHFGRSQTVAVSNYDGLKKKIAIIDSGVKPAIKGAAKANISVDEFDVLAESIPA